MEILVIETQEREGLVGHHRKANSMKYRMLPSKLFTTILFSMLMSLLVSTSCFKKKLPADCERFFKELNSNERKAEFKTYDYEKQFRIYRCGFDVIPIESDESYQIAARGREIIPDLSRRLKNENDPITKYGIILIFESLAVRNQLEDPKETLQIIEDETGRMKPGWWKDYSLKALQRTKKVVAHNK